MSYLNFLKDKYKYICDTPKGERWKSLPYTWETSNHPPKKTST